MSETQFHAGEEDWTKKTIVLQICPTTTCLLECPYYCVCISRGKDTSPVRGSRCPTMSEAAIEGAYAASDLSIEIGPGTGKRSSGEGLQTVCHGAIADVHDLKTKWLSGGRHPVLTAHRGCVQVEGRESNGSTWQRSSRLDVGEDCSDTAQPTICLLFFFSLLSRRQTLEDAFMEILDCHLAAGSTCGGS